MRVVAGMPPVPMHETLMELGPCQIQHNTYGQSNYQKPMLMVQFVGDLKARQVHCCTFAHDLACCPAVLASLLPCRWPALHAFSLADKDAYIFAYYGINPNLVVGRRGETLCLGLTLHAGKLTGTRVMFTKTPQIGSLVSLTNTSEW